MKPRDDKKVESIYEATLQLVKEEGLSGITMSMIVKKLNWLPALFTYILPTKRRLIVKLFDICASNYALAYFVDVNPTGDFKKNFRQVWMNIVIHNVRYFEQIIFLEQCFHSPFIPEEIRVVTKSKFKPWYDFIEKEKRKS